MFLRNLFMHRHTWARKERLNSSPSQLNLYAPNLEMKNFPRYLDGQLICYNMKKHFSGHFQAKVMTEFFLC